MRLFAAQEGLGPQVATAPFRTCIFLVFAVVRPIKLIARLLIGARKDRTKNEGG